MAEKKKAVSLAKTLIGIVGLLILVIVLLSYKLYALSGQPQVLPENFLLSLTYAPSPEMISHGTNSTSVFNHPDLDYSVDVPEGWTPRIYRSLAGSAVQPYADVIFLSPDFTQTTNLNTSDVDGGASIFIRGSETVYPSIKQKFEENKVAQRIAQNVTHPTVDGVPAVQYEYDINGERVTNVTLIKNGFWYLIKYQYADQQTKDKYWNDFQAVVKSFAVH